MELPSLARKILFTGNGWIIGSSALNDKITNDLDILIPFSYWSYVSVLIPGDAKPNTFGGWKFVTEGIEIDLFPGEITDLLSKQQFKAAYHVNSGAKIIK